MIGWIVISLLIPGLIYLNIVVFNEFKNNVREWREIQIKQKCRDVLELIWLAKRVEEEKVLFREIETIVRRWQP